MADEIRFPCPACGFLVFNEPPGSYAICPVCQWEDDHVQLRYPTMRGGANQESLSEWQQQISQNDLGKVIGAANYHQDPTWRPLNEDDLQFFSDRTPDTAVQHFDVAAETSPTDYYWKR